MSSIPPNVIGPIAQSNYAANQQAEKTDQDQNQQSARTREQQRLADQRQSFVGDAEHADEHARVNPDDHSRQDSPQHRHREDGEPEDASLEGEDQQPTETKQATDKDQDAPPRLDITV